ncbi:hypothetical protein [Metarhizobium album]|uniref:hypothetical protein n=1 Tax=Metarhizobium album TaxID=2182425 RepID=UPI000FFED92C|nr:hypothetical protein [Rhizobium album]
MSKLLSDPIYQVHHARACPFEAKRDGASIVLSGYALEWAVVGNHGQCFSAAAVKPVAAPLIVSHVTNKQIGTCALEADGEGMFCLATLSHDCPADIVAQIERRDLSWFTADITVPISQASQKICVDEWSLAAVSLVRPDFGIRRATASRGPLLLESKAAVIDLLRDNGVPRAAAERIASGGWPALSGITPVTPSSLKVDIDNITQALKGAVK